MTKIRAERNERDKNENKKYQWNQELVLWTEDIGKNLSRLMRRETEHSVRNKRGDITTDNTEIESILRGWNYIPTNCTTHRNGQIPRVNLPRLNHIKK